MGAPARRAGLGAVASAELRPRLDYTLGQLAAQDPGTYHETFHFVLNNHVAKDNRIPPYGMGYDEAGQRNALPVPADQYGAPGPGGSYRYWDEVALDPPAGAAYATIDLLYQPTSWEYIQFLYLANGRQNPFLADEGAAVLDAWRATGMAAPYVMASATWGTPPAPRPEALVVRLITTWSVGKSGNLVAQTSTFTAGSTVGLKALVSDEVEAPLTGAQLFVEIRDAGNQLATSLQGFSDDIGIAVMRWKTSRGTAPGVYTAKVVEALKSGYQFDPNLGVTMVSFTVQ